ncbi:MAG: class I SAM-dependent methyltransferase, partial [Gammaproteobacteria bacterium]|nr:class I SAM-dependent methyltransferase [Gammaproteobacteria bacterium]
VLSALPGGKVLEIGGGSGVLAAHLLLMLEQKQCLPEEYLLLELSASLQSRQRQTIERMAPHLLDRVRWLDALPDQGFRGVVIANEVIDAMPVQCFRIREGKVCERRVGLDDNGFTWLEEPADSDLVHQVKKLFPEGLPSGAYDSEWNPWLSPWVAALSEMLEQGVVLLVDYGYARSEYYHPERTQGTLICHYRHRVHDAPFYLPGLQDITASVDFTAVAEAAVEHGLQVSGYTHQAAFLFGNDLQGEYEQLDTDDSKERAKLAHEIRQLTLPGEMGERFKVMALSKKYDQSLRGFAWQDLRAVL